MVSSPEPKLLFTARSSKNNFASLHRLRNTGFTRVFFLLSNRTIRGLVSFLARFKPEYLEVEIDIVLFGHVESNVFL